MKIRFGSLISLLLGSLLLASLVACSETTDTQPATPLPDSSSVQAAKPLSASERMAVDEFANQWQTIDQEWDQLHQDFDLWRAGLTSCHRSSVQEALQGFAASFADVTEQARNLPRTIVIREPADTLIAAAEEEEAAFRQLRDRWQPDNLSLFELVEQRRSDAARAQRNVEDMTLELQEQLEAAGDPKEREALEEFSDALDAIRNDWTRFHDDYAKLQRDAGPMDPAAVLAQLQQLIAQFEAVVEAVSGLPSSDATGSMVERLQGAAEAEIEALSAVNDGLLGASTEGPNQGASSPLDEIEAIIEESEALLKQVSRTTKVLVDDDPEENLAEVRNFDDQYRSLLVTWNAFHQGYQDWRKIDGGVTEPKCSSPWISSTYA